MNRYVTKVYFNLNKTRKYLKENREYYVINYHIVIMFESITIYTTRYFIIITLKYILTDR